MFYGREEHFEQLEFSSVTVLPGWEAVMGHQFENLVINDFRELLPHVGLGNRLFVPAGALLNLNGTART